MSDHSRQLEQLAAALVRVQTGLQAAKLDATGWIGRPGASDSYRYATLNSVWEAARQALTANGLAISQTCEPGDAGQLRLTTWLLHTSGQWLCGTQCLPVAWRSPRGYGSALTHARRYGLAAIVGLCVEQDDDAAAARESPELLAEDRALHECAPTSAADGPDGAEAGADLRVGHGRAARQKHRVGAAAGGWNGSEPPD